MKRERRLLSFLPQLHLARDISPLKSVPNSYLCSREPVNTLLQGCIVSHQAVKSWENEALLVVFLGAEDCLHTKILFNIKQLHGAW